MSSVKVAVRVRPFNTREIERGAKCIIEMSGQTTKIINPAGIKSDGSPVDPSFEKSFSYDYSYSSFDPSAPNYITQEKVFNDLGREVLQNAWEGFNTSLFAYGQTGSGKSYSMLGYGEDRGIIPRACEELFVKIKQCDDPNMFFKVEVSFMEIYNESVKDLLDPRKNNKGGLKVRNHPQTGPYVEDLTRAAVQSYREIEEIMDEGSKARTVAATNMNATSSRSHAVFTIVFSQSRFDPETQIMSEKVSKINLVDLAGSERADSTGATGDRLKEGANINKSLSTLGKVISALAESAGGKKNVFVPYRDSVLTWLLKESLGGNAKTIMIAAISPADINYDETLSTLRYAERAKKIKNQAFVNEDPNVRLIRELREEILQLKKLLSSGGSLPLDMLPQGSGENEAEALKEQLAQREKMITELNKTWEERLSETSKLQAERELALKSMGVAIKASQGTPYFVNLNEDPALSECLVYYLSPGITRIGRPDADVPQNIQLTGLSIAKEHAIVENTEEGVTIEPIGTAPVFVNGKVVTEVTPLPHSARVILGTNHIFRFHNGVAKKEEESTSEKGEVIDWNYALKELFASQNKAIFKDVDEEESKKELAQLKKLNDEIERQKLEAMEIMAKQKREYEQKLQDLEKIVESRDVEYAREQARLEFEAQQEEFDTRDRLLTDAYEKQKDSFMANSMQRWQEKKRRLQLQDQLMSTMITINEANAICEALQRKVMFSLSLSVADYKDLSEKLKTTELAVEMTNKLTGNVGLLSLAKFMEKVYALREIYSYFLENGTEPKLEDDPFAIPKEDRLLGITHIYLKGLQYLLSVSRDFPLVDPTGQQIGQLKIEIIPKTELKNIELLKGTTLEFTLKIINATIPSDYLKGLDYVYCKYNLWDIITKDTPIDESCKCDFNFEEVLSVDVNEDTIAMLKESPLSLGLWGHLSPDKAPVDHEELRRINSSESPLTDEEAKAKNNYEFLLKLEIGESDKHDETHGEHSNGDIHASHDTDIAQFPLVEVKEEPWNNPGSLFCLNQSKHRIFIISVIEASDPNIQIEKCDEVVLDNIRFMDTKERVEDKIALNVVSVKDNKIIACWPYSIEPLLIEKAQTKRLLATVAVKIKMPAFSNSIKISDDICFRLQSRGKKERGDTTSMLEQFKGMLQSKKKPQTQSTFRVKLTKEKRIDEKMEISAIIEQHNSEVQQVSQFLQAEKLRQELELQAKLEAQNIEAPPLSPTVSRSLQELELAMTPKLEDESRSSRVELNSPSRRGLSKPKRLRSVSSVYVVVEGVNRRGYEKSGCLKKKKKKDGTWVQKWVGLGRPYLYVADDAKGKRERAVDISKCVVTVGAHDAENPFSFAVVTTDHIWMFSATSPVEMQAWMKAIDPLLDIGGKTTRTARKPNVSTNSSAAKSSPSSDSKPTDLSPLRNSQEMVEEERHEIPELENAEEEDIFKRLAQLEAELKEKDRALAEANNKIRENEEKVAASIKLEEQLKEANSKIEKLKLKKQHLKDETTIAVAIEKKLAEAEAIIQERSRTADFLKDELKSKTQEDMKKADELVYKLAEAETIARTKQEELERLKETNDEILAIERERERWQEQTLHDKKIQELQLELKDKDTKILMLKEKMKTTLEEADEMKEKHQKLLDKVKFLQEEIYHYNSRLEMMQTNLSMACVELEKKEALLRDKVVRETPPRNPKQKVDPVMLEDQLRKLRDAMTAHISHNAFLGQEIRRYEAFNNMQKVQNETILKLQRDIDELQSQNRKLKLRDALLTERIGESQTNEEVNKLVEEQATLQNLQEELLFLKQNYFMSIAVNQKLSQTQAGRMCNVQLNALFDEVLEKKIDIREWPKWITNEIVQKTTSL